MRDTRDKVMIDGILINFSVSPSVSILLWNSSERNPVKVIDYIIVWITFV